VRIACAELVPFRLKLRRPLQTAHGEIAVRSGTLLALRSDSGATGWGEASPLPGFGLEGPERCEAALASAAEGVLGREVSAYAALSDDLENGFPRERAARGAVACALHDLAAQAAGVPLGTLLAPDTVGRPGRVRVNAIVSGTTCEAAAAQARSLHAAGFRSFKLKLGSAPLRHDLARIAAVRAALGDGVRIRADANGAWSESEASCAVELLADSQLEWIEQPVASEALPALARLRARSPTPIAADESASSEAGARAVIAAGAADVLVLKPAALGGVAAAARVARRARSAGLGVVVTSLLDSAIGVYAAAHLAASLPDTPDAGLATGELFEHDVARTPSCEPGWLALPARAGLGLSPDPAWLDAAARGPLRRFEA
jgi:o-succinylbenzoate synthase